MNKTEGEKKESWGWEGESIYAHLGCLLLDGQTSENKEGFLAKQNQAASCIYCSPTFGTPRTSNKGFVDLFIPRILDIAYSGGLYSLILQLPGR